ncbi:ComF family protein [Sulfurimonas sp.]|uniref:ComF family protein n=1 Tax=Sulfurimonas sp. TaxID=2022749 RepID=UPI0035628FDC
MRCMLCESLSFTHICNSCQNNFLKPRIYKRKINNTEVISFYKYEEIKDLLHTKHTDLGYHIYNILARNSFKKFADEFYTKEKYNSIAIDDHTRNGYSHTSILNNALSSNNIKPHHNKLLAQNKVTYSGKTKAFRLNNPRDFRYKNNNLNNIILVDDIVTTGTTINEAIKLVGNENIAFCMCLVDISKK